MKEYGKNLEKTLLFVDFSKAFDYIHRGKMKYILPAYGLLKEIVSAMIMLSMVRLLDGDADFNTQEESNSEEYPVRNHFAPSRN